MQGGVVREAGGGPEAWCLSGLLFFLPFEPRRPALALLGFQVTLLEAAAALAGAALLWRARRRLPAALRRPPLPLLCLLYYAGAHMLSVAFAPAHRDLAFKFSLRMAVMAGFACVVSVTPLDAQRKALAALATSACVVALLAVLEGAGARFLDPFLDRFREMAFNVGGSRRASAGSEYPNLAAAFLMYGLLAGAGLLLRFRHGMSPVLTLSALLSFGLLFTYSRGALVAAGVGLLALIAVNRRGGARIPLAALGILLASSAAFAWRGENFRLRLGSEGTKAWYGAVYTPIETSLTLSPGESRVTPVRVTNAGLKTWSAREAFHLSYHWYDAKGGSPIEGARTSLPGDVGSGETVLLDAVIQAPPREGRYLLVWDMVHEHTAWFGEQGVRPAAVPALVSASRAAVALRPPARETPPASALPWRPGRKELWGLSLAMWRRHPWTGVGSDNFRWLYGPAAGLDFWDSRVFSNNAFLEAGATTGTLGLFALTATFVASARAALGAVHRALPGSEAAVRSGALLALIAGLSAHAVVDYVLAFTGHYLLLGFVVGAVASLVPGEAAA